MAPSDSDRDCSSAHRYQRDPAADPPAGVKWPHQPGLSGLNQGQDSESGGSQPPSPRASRRRQVNIYSSLFGFIVLLSSFSCFGFRMTLDLRKK